MTYPARTPDQRWDDVVRHVQRELADYTRALERDVVPITNLRSGEPDHLDAAVQIISRLQSFVANFPVRRLLEAAVACDHPTMDKTPGQLLDAAAAAISAELYDRPDAMDEARAEHLADKALRSVGVIR
jgi:hypothetical protein